MTILRRLFLTFLSVAILGVTTQPMYATGRQEQDKSSSAEILNSWKKAVTLNWSKITQDDLFNIAASVVVVAGAYGLYHYSFGVNLQDQANLGGGINKSDNTRLRSDSRNIISSEPAATEVTPKLVSTDKKLDKKAENSVQDTKEKEQSPVLARPQYIHLQPHESINQIQVASQSGASCGYHALLNAREILGHINRGVMPQQLNTARARTLFEGNNGRWRQHIQNRYIEQQSKRYLKNALHASMQLTDVQREEYTGFWGAIKWILADHVVRTLSTEELNALSNIVDVCVEQLLLNQPIDLAQANAPTIIAVLQQKYRNQSAQRQAAWQSVLGYFDAQEMQNRFGAIQLTPETALVTNIYTDNIFNDDIVSLINVDNLQNITVIEQPSLIMNRQNEPTYSTVRRLARASTFTHAFVLRTTYQDVSSETELTDETLKALAASGGTHWIAVVVRKTAGNIEYYVADSFYNGDRTNDRDVARLINALRGNQ